MSGCFVWVSAEMSGEERPSAGAGEGAVFTRQSPVWPSAGENLIIDTRGETAGWLCSSDILVNEPLSRKARAE